MNPRLTLDRSTTEQVIRLAGAFGLTHEYRSMGSTDPIFWAAGDMEHGGREIMNNAPGRARSQFRDTGRYVISVRFEFNNGRSSYEEERDEQLEPPWDSLTSEERLQYGRDVVGRFRPFPIACDRDPSLEQAITRLCFLAGIQGAVIDKAGLYDVMTPGSAWAGVAADSMEATFWQYGWQKASAMASYVWSNARVPSGQFCDVARAIVRMAREAGEWAK
jgi:hypothetical protein